MDIDRISGNWKMLGEAKRRWGPIRQATACHADGTTSGLCPSGALPPPSASAIGAAPCLFYSGAALLWQGKLTIEIKPESMSWLISTQPGEVHNVTERSGHSQSFDS